MAPDDGERGVKWWIRHVIVPLVGGGGFVAIVVAMMGSHPEWLRKAPALQIRSVGRPNAEVFLAGERLRVALKNVVASRVLWFFDEAEPLLSGVEVEQVFREDTSGPRLAHGHRIDAFFRDGDRYRSAFTTVIVEPAPPAVTLSVRRDSVRVGIAHDLQRWSDSTGWRLDSVYVTSYVNGRFVGPLPLQRFEASSWAAALSKLGLTTGEARWAQLVYVTGNSDRLVVMNRIP